MKKIFILIITILVLVGGVFLFFNIDKIFSNNNSLPPIENEENTPPITDDFVGIKLDKDIIYF